MDSSNSIQRELTIEADPATVFAFFTDPQRLIRWVGASATLDARPGGLMMVDVQQEHLARGEFKEVVPVTRLSYTWGWEGSENVPPGSSLIEIDLMPKNGSTVVHFTHSGLPPEQVSGHTEGWNHYLSRLVVAASGGDPGPDPWRQKRPQ